MIKILHLICFLLFFILLATSANTANNDTIDLASKYKNEKLNLVENAIIKLEVYMNKNLYINPDYPIIFAKYFVETKNANINISDSIIKQLTNKKDICFLQALYKNNFKCSTIEKTIHKMLVEEQDSVGSLVLIGLNSKHLNKVKYNALFAKLSLDENHDYKNTHLYFALKMIEQKNPNFLTRNSKTIAQNIEDKLMPVYLKQTKNDDLYYETLAFLTEFKNVDDYLDELSNVLSKQKEDGGFATLSSKEETNLHPSILTLWYLLNIRNYLKK